MNDVFKLRPGHTGGGIPTVERKEWGDTAGVGPAVIEGAKQIGEAVLDEVVSKLPGASIGSRLFKRFVRRNVSKFKFNRQRQRYPSRRSGGYRRYGGGYGRGFSGMRYKRKYRGYGGYKRKSAFRNYKKRRRYY